MDESFVNNYCYALVLQDYLSQWPDMQAEANRIAPTVAKGLAGVIYRHRLSFTIIHDLAPEFLSDILQDTVFVLKVKKLPTSPKHAQSDGLVERFNQTLKAMLLKLVTNKGCDLDGLKEPLLFAYQTMPHSLIKKTLLYGRDTKLPTALNFYSKHLSYILNMEKYFLQNIK